MFGILGWILFGLVVGVIAKLVMPGRDPGGIFVTIILGIVGAGVAALTSSILSMVMLWGAISRLSGHGRAPEPALEDAMQTALDQDGG